jgi:hypothetical protein
MSARKPWERSFFEKIYDALFLETNIFRTFAFLWILFWGTVIIGGGYIAIHFIHKYW